MRHSISPAIAGLFETRSVQRLAGWHEPSDLEASPYAAAYPGVIDFQPSWDDPPPGLVAAYKKHAAARDASWYAYTRSKPSAERAAAAGIARATGVPVAPDDVLMTSGCIPALAAAIRTLCHPGDEGIYMRPAWWWYAPLLTTVGAVPVAVGVDAQTFEIDVDAIAAAVTPRTRVVIVNTPHNPTGRIYSEASLRALAQILDKASSRRGSPVYLISDEAYQRVILDESQRALTPIQFYPFSVMCYTYSKTWMTPGVRIGCLALPPEMPDRQALKDALRIAQFIDGYTFPDAVLQYALTDLEADAVGANLDLYRRRRDKYCKALTDIGYTVYPPAAGIWLMIKSPMADDHRFVQLLRQHGIDTGPLSFMEFPGYFRLSFALKDELFERALPALTTCLAIAKNER